VDELNAAPGGVALVGFFDPATIAQFMAQEAATQVSGIRSSPGVPIHRLVEGLVSRGIRSSVVGGIRGAAAVYVESNPLSVAIYPKRGGWPFLLNGLRRERNAVLALLQRIQPSVVHAHWTFEGGRAVADWSGPKLLTLHDAAWEYARLAGPYKPSGIAFTARWLMDTSATLKRFDHVIAESPYVETYLRMKHRYRGEIRVIPTAVPELPADLTVTGSFPKSDEVTFGCYGSPSGVKNVHTALAAFYKVKRKIPGARMLVFGGGWEQDRTEFATSRVEFMGALPHKEFLKTLVEKVDVWVHPSKNEAQSLAVCEAIQAGCPVIAGRQSGAVSWTLDYGRAGLLVDIEDVDEVAWAMRETVKERAGFDAMVVYGRKMIQDRFGLDRILEMHLLYYQDVIRGHNSKRSLE
jgi:glycosyltransferase involved in cell wall biosynthesis